MKLIFGTALILGAFAIAALHAPGSSVAAAEHSSVAAASLSASPLASSADEGDEVEALCPWTIVCDEPYGQFPTLKACRASGCTSGCGIVYECNP
jgi:hypothetical protein